MFLSDSCFGVFRRCTVHGRSFAESTKQAYEMPEGDQSRAYFTHSPEPMQIFANGHGVFYLSWNSM